MADDIDDDDVFEDEESTEVVDVEEDSEILEDQDEIDDKELAAKNQYDARRRLEQLKEERELQRLINGDLYDWN